MRHLHQLRIKYKKVVTNPRDESSALLRLADALAGLVRDHWEGNKYAKEWYRKLVKQGFLTDLQQQ